MASPSMMPSGKGAFPEATARPVAAAATANTGNGQRRSNMIGPYTRSAARMSRCPRSWGPGASTRAHTASTVQAMSTTVASHWR